MKTPVGCFVVLLTILACVSYWIGSLGEEIGWRGFLVPELRKRFSFSVTSIVTGMLWAVYHFPLLIFLIAPRLGASVLPLMIFVTISAIGLSFVLSWLRLKSGSVWTAVLFHSALNIHLQGFFQPLTVETSELSKYISGEQGLMMAIVAVLAGYLFWRQRYRIESTVCKCKKLPRNDYATNI